MSRIKDIIQHLENLAPLAYQESYDNAGLLTGNPDTSVTGVLITLDITEEVVTEAINLGCNLIIAHHPIIFKGLKALTGKTYVERTIIAAIKNDVALYATHTNLDNIQTGVNKKICDRIGLINTKIMVPKTNTLSKLVTFVPQANVEAVKKALFEAGAGQIGNYSDCSFSVSGHGTFTPNEKAKPTIGQNKVPETVAEIRIEALLPTYKSNVILAALRAAHPYEEVAYYLNTIDNTNQEVGSGMIGELPMALKSLDFLMFLKEKMALTTIKHTALCKDNVLKVAVCGGSGSFLLNAAIRAQADVFVTADFKYHEYFDAENNIIIADIGHYESEVFTKDLIYDILTKKFSKFAVNLSKTVTNPISYL